MAIIMSHSKRKPRKDLDERPFRQYEDWYTTTMRVPKRVWNRFDLYCKHRGTVRSKMLTCLIEEELAARDDKAKD